MDVWWYLLGSTRTGPVSREELARLLKSRTIEESTLVWKKGFQSWTALSQVGELSDLSSGVPPPITADGISDISKYDVAGKWPRFFARMFDVWWETLAVSFVGGFILGQTSGSFVAWINQPGSGYLFAILCLPVALLLDAVVYQVAGGTPGKLMVGIRVVSQGGNPLSFGDYLSRNMSLWPSGLALGVPLVNLFVMAGQARRIDNGLLASYDEKPAYRVVAIKTSVLRKFIFCIAFFSLLVLMSALNSIGQKQEIESISASLAPDIHWINPVSGQTAAVKGVWQPSSDLTSDGLTVYMFNEVTDHVMVIMGVEHATGYELSDYVSLFTSSNRENMKFSDGGRYFVSSGRDAWAAEGTMRGSPSSRLTVEIIGIGDSYWRLVTVQVAPYSYSDRMAEDLRQALRLTMQ